MNNGFLRVFLFGLTVVSSLSAFASHITGGDITYVAVPGSPNQFVVTVKLYRDCFGIPYEDPITVQWESPSGCYLPGNTSLGLVQGTGVGNEIQTSTYPPCASSTCTGGFGYGIQEWVYTGLIDLGGACNDWVISYTSCCRNAALSTADPNNMYIETTLNNQNVQFDNSPVFNYPPVATFCVGRSYQLNMSCTDPDGDSLVYILADAWEAAGSTVNYNPPYAGSYPIASNPVPSINPQTGIITFYPTTVQVGVLAILVEQYDYTTGQLIGTIRRDIQVNVEAVCHDLPTFDSLRTLTYANLLSCHDSIIQIKLDWSAQCFTLAPDGSDFRLFSPSHVQVPITQAMAYNCTGGSSDSMALHLGAPGLFENGIYMLIVKNGFDNNTILDTCGLAIPENDTSFFSFNNCFTGIEELNRDRFHLSLYPIPARSVLNVQSNIPGLKEVEVLNDLGEKVISVRIRDFSWELDLAGLPAGVYSLSIVAGNVRKSAFFVVIH